MFTLVRKIISRLTGIAVEDLTTAERQIFNLLVSAGWMKAEVGCFLDFNECAATGLQFPDVVNVTHRGIDVEIPEAWVLPMVQRGLVTMIGGTPTKYRCNDQE